MTSPSSASLLPVAPSSSAELSPDGLPKQFGKYTLVRKLATGGMAELFLALQRSVAGFEKLVVIKRILPKMNEDRSFIDMLLAEARVAATLSHPNVVQIFDVGDVDGTFYIAMEHVHGEDIRTIVRRMKKEGHREFPLSHALHIVSGIAAGLAYAHGKRDLDGTPLHIVHRDISPQNVVVTYSGDVKVVDFGIAKSDTSFQRETEFGKLKGKVPYMSPEQARGLDVDWRSDIFSAGIILFELTTGRRLFKGESEYETMRLICEKPYPLPSSLRADYPPQLEAIVMRALAKSPDARYQSARELQAALDGFAREYRIEASSVAMSTFMQSLFGAEIANANDPHSIDRHLVRRIREQQQSAHELTNGLASDAPPRADSKHPQPSVPAAAHTVTSAEPLRSGRPRWLAPAGAGALVVLMALGVFFGLRARAASQQSARAVAGKVTVASDPAGASLWVNGDLRVEKSPAVLDKLPLGRELELKVTKDGYEPSMKTLTLSDTEPSKDLSVTLVPGKMVLELHLKPEFATARVDDVPVGGAEVRGLKAGEEHDVLVTAPGFVDAHMKVSGQAFETKRLDVTLEPSKGKPGAPPSVAPSASASAAVKPEPGKSSGVMGKLNVATSSGWCNVSVDGAGKGPTPLAGLELPSGTHKVTCTTEDGKVQTASVVVPENGVARYKFTL
ncbi:MAG: serine/threonine-protein kinase [Polyangiaceae bacterium]